MGWSYTRIACAVFCSAVLRVSPRYNCAVFCITAVHTLCVFCSVTHVLCVFCSVIDTLCVFYSVTPVLCVFCSSTHVLCAFCSVACPVHLEARATLVFEPSRNSLLCGLQHSPRLRCCTNVIWTLRWGNAIVCITIISLVFCLSCVSYVSLILVADVFTHFAGSNNHSTKLLLTLVCWCWYATYMLMCYVLCGMWFVICACT